MTQTKGHKYIKRRVERGISRKLPKEFWKMVYNDGDFNDIVAELEEEQGDERKETIGFAIEWVRTRLQFWESGRRDVIEPERKIKLSPIEPREMSHSGVFSSMVAAYINGDEEVKKFRQVCLEGKYLKGLSGQSEIARWISRQPMVFQDELNKLVKRFRWLQGLNSSWMPSWEVQRCILTGDTPMFNLVTVSLAFDTLWGEKYIIRASPHARPAEIARAFERARDATGTNIKERRKLSTKTVRLAEFVLKHEGSWQNRMDKWNAKYPKWHYEDRRRFARDAKAALDRGSFEIFTV